MAAKIRAVRIRRCCPRTPRWRFSFSIFLFREPSDVTTIQMDQSAELLTHTHSASLSCSSADFSAWTQPETAGHSEARPGPGPSTHTDPRPGCGCVCVLRPSSGRASPCPAVPQTPRSNHETTPASQLTLSAPAASPATSRQHGTQTPPSILICLSLLVSFSGC